MDDFHGLFRALMPLFGVSGVIGLVGRVIAWLLWSSGAAVRIGGTVVGGDILNGVKTGVAGPGVGAGALVVAMPVHNCRVQLGKDS
jgi:hypothetical protein